MIDYFIGDYFLTSFSLFSLLAYLACDEGEMVVKLNFTEPFIGVGYANGNDSKDCRILGDGSTKQFIMHIPLHECGTKQEGRIFVNNVVIRFHRTLELEEDEVTTVICKYPPPIASDPPPLPPL